MLDRLYLGWLRIVNGEKGQTLAEYGLLLALIALVCIAAVTALGGAIQTVLGKVAAGI